MPRPATPLVGRDGKLAELTALLGSPEVRLVTLTGPGGSGKTRLAIALAQRLVESFPDGVFFVPLAAVTTEDVLWSSIGETLDVPPHSRTPPSLFDLRTENVCGECQQWVDKSLPWLDPMAPQVDHKTPVALGGACFDRANLQLVSSKCNRDKGIGLSRVERTPTSRIW